MKVSEKWLREWVNPAISTDVLIQQLTMTGLEVEGSEPAASNLEHLYVAHVTQVERHPNADRLSICQVTLDGINFLTIVCGAANVHADMKAVLAIEGAVLPGGLTIKRAKIRGIESNGMLCSLSELGLAETNEGIIELEKNAPMGIRFADYIQLPDSCIDINITPNRGDCLSIQGIARELAAINNCPLKPATFNAISAHIQDSLPVTVQTVEDCPRYLGRVIREINAKADTPLWLKERLRRCGMRSIHPVVDITNYVMLELGQPLHAFDYEKIEQSIEVRRAHHGETLTLLDGQTIELNESMLVIADAKKALALAGVMGGMNASVTEETVDIFLESAFFNPITIANCARGLKLHTDAAYRYERTTDPELPQRAIERATELLMDIVGGKPGPITEKTSATHLPKPAVISLRKNRISRILGFALDDKQIESLLNRLAMPLKSTAEGWEVISPSYRSDIRLEIDLIEEIARIYGYNNISANLPKMSLTISAPSEQKLNLMRLRHLLADKGYFETVSYAFTHPKVSELLNPEQSAIKLVNPISTDLSVLRNSLWAGLLSAVNYNVNRQQSNVRLFEIGVNFIQENNSISHQSALAGVITGDAYPLQWGIAKRRSDFYDLKGDVEALLALMNSQDFTFEVATHPALHPGQAACIKRKEETIGWIGALHPSIQQELDLPECYLFELQLDKLEAISLPRYQMPSKFPAVKRDLAILVDKAVPFAQICDRIKHCTGDLLQNLQLFDLYQGDKIDADKKSIALSLTFQLHSRTLIDSDVNDAIEQVVTMLKQEFNAILRI